MMEHFISDDDRDVTSSGYSYAEGFPPAYTPGPLARGIIAFVTITVWCLAAYGLWEIAT